MTREEAIKTLSALYNDGKGFLDETIIMAIEALKEPERVHAHWNLIIRYDDEIEVFRCSCCSIPQPTKFTYCPSCGAIMDEKRGG